MPITPEDDDDNNNAESYDRGGDLSASSIGEMIAEQPLAAVAIAAVFGFIVGKLIL